MNTDKRTSIALLLILVVTLVFMHLGRKDQLERQKLLEQQKAEEAQRLAEEAEKAEADAPKPDADTAPPAKPADSTSMGAAEPATDTRPEPTEPKTEKAEPTVTTKRDAIGEERQISFGTKDDALMLTLTTRGAAITSARLPKHPTSSEDPAPVEVIRGGDDIPATLALTAAEDGLALPLDSVNYEIVEQDNAAQRVFRRDFNAGIRVTKTYALNPASQHVTLTVEFENTGDAARELRYEIFGASRMVPEFFDRGMYLEGAIATSRGNNGVDVTRDKAAKLIDSKAGEPGPPKKVTYNAAAPIMWAGSSNKYFAGILRPFSDKENSAESWIFQARLNGLYNTDYEIKPDGSLGDPISNVAASFVTQVFEVKAGDTVKHQYLLYIGPKDRKLMAGVPEYNTFGEIVSYGWSVFAPFSKLLLWLLDFFHGIIPNYGVGIVLLTLVVRGCLHPLQRKAQVSMRRMQKLQPEIKKLQEKYKNDKQKLSQEQMALFREAGVNPMGGCLPLLIQMPIIIGLFRAIQLSVDLRCAPFMLWIDDLSRPDTVTIGKFAVHVLPILMIVSFIVQQMTMPKPPDPQQAKQQKTMMIMMTVMFGFLFYKMASGVVLYWLTSTFIGILEQKQIKASLARMEAEEEAAKSGAKAKA